MFHLDAHAIAKGDRRLDNPTVHRLWQSFTLGQGDLSLDHGEALTLVLGNVTPPAVPDGCEYSLVVTEDGAAVRGTDYGGLVRGVMVLLMQITYRDGAFLIAPAVMEGRYRLNNRMIHLCVFPENDLTYMKRLIRLCGLCQYTHVVLEFWGMVQYDCLPSLAWPHAFTKDEVRELIAEMRDLGMAPIPMVNSLGHATASRLCFGKHVVLDQDPTQEELFTPDGWAWNIENPRTVALLAQMRQELYDLFGEGDYIHVGCDEAYYISNCPSLRQQLPAYLNALTCQVAAEGRRPMLWMDMLLEGNQDPGYYATADAQEACALREALHPSSVWVDWQYDVKQAPVATLQQLAHSEADVMGAPWLTEANYVAHLDTIEQEGLFGLMLTTWQSLKGQMYGIPGCAQQCGAKLFGWCDYADRHTVTATLLRRVSFEGVSYADAGWGKEQIDY